MAQIEIGGASISYIQRGKGESLILVHGWNGSGALWKRNIGRLSSRFRVIVPDLPGFGDSQLPQDFSCTLEGYSNFIEDLRKALHLSKVNLVGHSMGGSIVLHYAAHHPLQVSKLVLIDAPAHKKALNWEARLPFLDRAIYILRPLIGKRILEAMIYSSVKHSKNLPYDFVQEAVSQAAKISRRVMYETTRFIRRLDLEREVEMIELPVLIIHGEEDNAVKPKEAHRLREKMANARLVMVPDCVHCPNYERPELVNKLIQEFILGEE